MRQETLGEIAQVFSKVITADTSGNPLKNQLIQLTTTKGAFSNSPDGTAMSGNNGVAKPN